MYLTHFAVLHEFSKLGVSAIFRQGNIGSILHYVGVVLVTALFSYVSYMMVERRGIHMGKRVINGLEQRAVARGEQAMHR